MIFVIMVLWVLAGLSVYRRVGFAVEKSIGTNNNVETHEFRSVCGSCRCKNCGETWGHHYTFRLYSMDCQNYEQDFKLANIHARTMFLAPVVLATWPGIFLVWAFRTAGKRLGLSAPQVEFWKSAPQVKSRVQKEQSHEDELISLKNSIAQLEKELGLGQK